MVIEVEDAAREKHCERARRALKSPRVTTRESSAGDGNEMSLAWGLTDDHNKSDQWTAIAASGAAESGEWARMSRIRVRLDPGWHS